MLSGSEASAWAMLTTGGLRCFAAAQHDTFRPLFHGMPLSHGMTCLERLVLAGLIENLIEDDAGGD